jgi:putative FmdB family regulatory protein
MPLYSYLCNDCGASFELLTGMTYSQEKEICKKCGSKNITRQMSSFSVGNTSASGKSPSCTPTL